MIKGEDVQRPKEILRSSVIMRAPTGRNLVPQQRFRSDQSEPESIPEEKQKVVSPEDHPVQFTPTVFTQSINNTLRMRPKKLSELAEPTKSLNTSFVEEISSEFGVVERRQSTDSNQEYKGEDKLIYEQQGDFSTLPIDTDTTKMDLTFITVMRRSEQSYLLTFLVMCCKRCNAFESIENLFAAFEVKRKGCELISSSRINYALFQYLLGTLGFKIARYSGHVICLGLELQKENLMRKDVEVCYNEACDILGIE